MTLNTYTEEEIFWVEYNAPLKYTTADMPLFEQTNQAIEKGVLYCVIDITQPKFLGSVDLGVMITILTKFRNKGGEVLLLKPSEQIQKILITTKLSAIFTMAEDRQDAQKIIESLKKTAKK